VGCPLLAGQIAGEPEEPGGGAREYQAALKLNGKYKPAQEALKQLGKD